jgi:MOSC domain-containing protein YiiM
VTSARVIKDFGLRHDAHAGDWHRQVSLLPFESFRKLENDVLDIKPGDFAENVTTTGIDLSAVEIGGTLRIGTKVILEITQIGKECHRACAIREVTGDCIMPREGIFARVIEGGRIANGDEIRYSTVQR